MQQTVAVLLFLPVDSEHWRRVREGFYAYARPHRPWGFAVNRSPSLSRLARLDLTSIDAAIGILSPDMAAYWREHATAPLIQWGPCHLADWPWVGTDNATAARQAATHLIERGFVNLGYYRRDETAPDPEAEAAFEAAARSASARVTHFQRQAEYPKTPLPAKPGLYFDYHLYRWLCHLPKPAAVWCANDMGALQVAEICRRTDIRVPDQIAVLGSGDDEHPCTLAHPRVSTLNLPSAKIGFESARLLDQWLATGIKPDAHLALAPTGVTLRPSTEVIATTDRAVSTAMQFIRAHAHEGIGVEDVLEQVRINRRDLERRFKRVLRASPYESILRVRLEQARKLLIDTDRTVLDIALACGFSDAARLTLAFHKAFDTSPGAFRKRYRLR